jgi:hypothetical protein
VRENFPGINLPEIPVIAEEEPFPELNEEELMEAISRLKP